MPANLFQGEDRRMLLLARRLFGSVDVRDDLARGQKPTKAISTSVEVFPLDDAILASKVAAVRAQIESLLTKKR